MTNSFMKVGASSLIALSMFASATPALARGHYDNGYQQNYDRNYYDDRGYDNSRDYRQSRYDRRDRQIRNSRNYNNYNNQRCDNGTGGTIIGAIAGGLLGHEIVGRRGDKTAGTIIGAGVGALAGRAIDRSDGRRC